MAVPFSPSFLAGDPRALAFLPASFRDASARIEHAKRAAQRRVNPKLLASLQDQDRALPPSEERQRNLDALAAGDACAVVTGQQMGLFLGPLYTFYKAASAVVTSRAIEAESGIRCVPIFWLQTEDHDFLEINHCHVSTPEGQEARLALGEAPEDSDRARRSIEHRLLGVEIARVLTEVEEILGSLPSAQQFLGLLRSQYKANASLSEAFAGVMASLFAKEGLILFNPRNPTVAKLAAPIYHHCITSCDLIAKALLDRSRAMTDADFEVQVHVRPSSPLFFVHEMGPDGPRFRVEQQGERWMGVGSERSFSTEELVQWIDTDPMRFSSSALLRPIIQDVLLPTVAYVGGPGEINYFAQLAPLYQSFDLPLPLVVPRARFRCLEAKCRLLLEQLHLAPSEVEGSREEVMRKVIERSGGDYPTPEGVEGQLMRDVSTQLDHLETILPSLDPSLSKAVSLTRGTIAHAVGQLVGRYRRALEAKDQVRNGRVDRVQSLLFPQGIPQERFYSLPYFACKYGATAFKEKVLEALLPFSTEVQNLQL